MDTVDPLIWISLFGLATAAIAGVWATISSRRYDRKFGRERDRPKAP